MIELDNFFSWIFTELDRGTLRRIVDSAEERMGAITVMVAQHPAAPATIREIVLERFLDTAQDYVTEDNNGGQ